MNNSRKRNISLIEGIRYVDGIPINRDSNFGILMEKRGYLNIIKNLFPDIESESYEVWDREHLYHTLDTGAVITITSVQGPSYAATGVERLVRSGECLIFLELVLVAELVQDKKWEILFYLLLQ
ncbi:MAG: hypothetical protein KKF65_04130 [Nanoarchaeota archaeon]|nr:hypothetical protein [Nanoarchaeota archaeon]